MVNTRHGERSKYFSTPPRHSLFGLKAEVLVAKNILCAESLDAQNIDEHGALRKRETLVTNSFNDCTLLRDVSGNRARRQDSGAYKSQGRSSFKATAEPVNHPESRE